MTPWDWATRPLNKFANFSGRAPRAEYWWFALLSAVAQLVAMVLDSLAGTDGALGSTGIILIVLVLALLIPSLAVSVRRLHDTDRSGWWLLIGLIPLVGVIVLLVFFVSEGTKDHNRFGSDTYPGKPAYA